MDPLDLRLMNAIVPGDTTPTQTPLTRSTVGDLPQCIDRLRQLTHWDEGQRAQLDTRRVRAIGACCLWKTSSTPVDAGSGAIVMFAPDGGVQLICGAVEIGQGTRTALTQLLAERLKMDAGRISIEMEVDTSSAPEHWKTVASRSTFLVGNAVLAAADDAIDQLRAAAADALGVPPEELEVGGERVYVRHRPESGLPIRELAQGYKHEGVATGKPIIGRGSYMMQHLTELDPATGKGVPGPEWTVGAQAVEVELDTRDYTYRIVRAYTVLDAGTVVNPMAARGQVTGGMSMGLSMAGREEFVLNAEGAILNSQLRTYPMHRYGDQPEYVVDFVETPHLEAPYGLRGIGEHGLIGIPAALASALSRAIGVQLYRLPLLPEQIWRQVKELRDDSL
jgi:CO/xanthine dehydrogenase Mo-binding subunit